MTTVTVEQLQAMVGTEVGASSWFEIDQKRINDFADATLDHQFIHLDAEKAAQTPFGTTIAHGFLTLSLLVPLTNEFLPKVEGTLMGVNYGTEKIRFLEPVKVNSKIRARATLKNAEDKGGNRLLLTYGITVDIEGSEKPALIADWLSMIFYK